METSLSLLDRLSNTPSDDDWHRLNEIYHPLLRIWLARAGVVESDRDDLSQEILLVVSREVRGFERRGPGAFRAWLRAILLNRTRSYFRSCRRRLATATGDSDVMRRLDELESPGSSLSVQFDREHDEYVVAVMLQQIVRYFKPVTWQAFRRYVLQGIPAATVAEELSISLNSVLLAKSRVLAKLREELEGFID